MLRTGYGGLLLRIVSLMVTSKYVRTNCGYIGSPRRTLEKSQTPQIQIKRKSTTRFKLNLTHFPRVGSPRRSFWDEWRVSAEMSRACAYYVKSLVTCGQLTGTGIKNRQFLRDFPAYDRIAHSKMCIYIYSPLPEFIPHLILFWLVL